MVARLRLPRILRFGEDIDSFLSNLRISNNWIDHNTHHCHPKCSLKNGRANELYRWNNRFDWGSLGNSLVNEGESGADRRCELPFQELPEPHALRLLLTIYPHEITRRDLSM